MLESLPIYAKVYICAVCALLGLVMGSALNCLSYRLAHDKKWAGGRSVCPTCGHTLSAIDLVPLFSWIFLKGKCRYCKSRISVRYPLTETALAVCYVSLLLRFDIGIHFVSTVILVSCLFCLTMVDLDIQIIPDRFIIIPAVVRLAELLYNRDFRALGMAFIPSLCMGVGVLLIALVMDKILKKESIGGGDIKLLFMLGLWFSFPCCLFLLLTACIIGLVIAFILIRGEKNTPFPFGPAIGIAAFITLLCGETVVNGYLSLF